MGICTGGSNFINNLFTDSKLFWIEYSAYIMIASLGLVFIICGIAIHSVKRLRKPCIFRSFINVFLKVFGIFDKFICLTPLQSVKVAIKQNLALFPIKQDENILLMTDAILFGIAMIGIIISAVCMSIGQLWYSKVLIFIISMFIPYYVVMLGFEIRRYRLNKSIPQMMDEFRSAFIKCNKIRPAFRECSMYIDKSLAGLLVSAADSSIMTEKLKRIQDVFNNIWFDIFVTNIIEYKDNGGELLEQLYKLGRTMGRNMGVGKKRNKRLIVYEAFVVLSSVLSIPAVMWVNKAVMDSGLSEISIPEINVTISRIVMSSIVSLVVIRVLRAF